MPGCFSRRVRELFFGGGTLYFYNNMRHTKAKSAGPTLMSLIVGTPGIGSFRKMERRENLHRGEEIQEEEEEEEKKGMFPSPLYVPLWLLSRVRFCSRSLGGYLKFPPPSPSKMWEKAIG